MREIKFRAWHIEDRFMFVPRRIDFPHFMIGDTAKWEVWYQYDDSDDSTPEHFAVEDISFYGDELELMQYTGLKDKNGKEIYEGDLLKYNGDMCPHCGKPFYDHPRPYQVVWDSRDLFFNAEEIKEDDRNYMSATVWPTGMAIIGNIYENPELREATRE